METPEEANVSAESVVDEDLKRLAHQMILFVYELMAIDWNAWNLEFWESFRRTQEHLTMSAKALRTFFFHDIMQNPDYLENLQYDVRSYINPMFNCYRKDVLQHVDCCETIDFVKDGPLPPVGAAGLPPIKLQTKPVVGGPGLEQVSAPVEHPSAPTVDLTLRYIYMSEQLSELLWTEDEKLSKPTLSMAECMQRIAVLTSSGIPLAQCIEPGMKCYDRVRQLGSAQSSENVPPTQSAESSSASYGTPLAQSTALMGKKGPMRAGLTPAKKESASSGVASFRTPLTTSTPYLPRPLKSRPDDGQQPCCSYRSVKKRVEKPISEQR
ncbi:uncharacterized protein LOC131215558 [Anopheles bellator]|uniref:uncharacterized protein LOC131215558 n=1 Tax=Anopheles bellator TaxID=139047 RepID=UPI002647CED9|nr:uncharacterized protein LOC131215558 [Anopheles bellator]